jgi:hypothetical protein
MPIRPGPGQEPRPPQQYVRGYAPPGGLVDAIAPGRVPTSRPVYDNYLRPIRGNYQLPEGASMNTFASVPSNGLINSAHNSVAYSQRLEPEPVCIKAFEPNSLDKFGNPGGRWVTVCPNPNPIPTERRRIANSAADELYQPGKHFPKTT